MSASLWIFRCSGGEDGARDEIRTRNGHPVRIALSERESHEAVATFRELNIDFLERERQPVVEGFGRRPAFDLDHRRRQQERQRKLAGKRTLERRHHGVAVQAQRDLVFLTTAALLVDVPRWHVMQIVRSRRCCRCIGVPPMLRNRFPVAGTKRAPRTLRFSMLLHSARYDANRCAHCVTSTVASVRSRIARVLRPASGPTNAPARPRTL